MPESAIFTAAVKLPADQRAAYLDHACGEDAALRREVESLLRAHDASGEFLPTRPPATEPDQAVVEGPGTVVGPYKLLQLIGEGGMGLVYMAEQTAPVRRRVALKIIKPGMDSAQVVARFEAERQALAMMDHQNIARVYDAGTTDTGRPFFVMELVHGVPITRYCDENHLTPRERLDLFVQVCHAVQHAHQKGVIHRDLKPSNVLVCLYDGRPVPKVIDFGIAKATSQPLTERTMFTQFGAMIGTLEYMSPEQAELSQLGVDTRSDVYSLGVLLYELLTGTTPLDRQRLASAAFDEIRRIIKEEEPPKPSTRLSTSGSLANVAAARKTEPARLSALVRGDLDWIVMKALEKDRTRRYDTASAFAADVRRFLAEEPIEARPPSAWYRFAKLARRHKAALATAALVAASLLVGIAVATWQAIRATDAEWRAGQDRDDAITARNAEADAHARLRQALEKQEADQYVWDMRAVPLLVEAGNIADAAGLLGRHVPKEGHLDRRGFEWFYWHRQLDTQAVTPLPDVPGDGLAWAASEDGSRLAWVGKGGDTGAEVRVWDVPARRLILQHTIPLDPTGGVVLRLAAYRPLFSRDGKRLAVHVGLVGFNGPWPNGRVVLDVATGRVLLRPTGDSQLGAGLIQEEVIDALSPDGRRYAAVSAGRVRVWDVDAGEEVCEPLPGRNLAHGAFTPDGGRLVTIQRPSGQQGRPRAVVWDVATGEELVRWEVSELGGRGEDVTLSPDGRRAVGVRVAPGGRQLVVWDAETGQEVHALTLPKLDTPRGVPQHFFSPDGSRLATLRSTFDPNRTVGIRPVHLTLCDLEAGALLPPLEGATNARFPLRRPGVTFSPDGKRLVFPGGNVLRTWDAATGKPHQTLRGHALPVEALAFTAGGRLRSVESDGSLREWNLDPPGPVVLPLAGFVRLSRGTEAFAVSPDGSRVATGTATDGDRNRPWAVRVTDRAGRLIRQLDPPADAAALPVHRLALDRSGTRVVATLGGTVGADAKQQGRGVVWDVATGAVLLERSLEGFVPSPLAISPDGGTVVLPSRTGLGTSTLRIFVVDGGQERPAIPVVGGVSEVHFSPDGRRLLVGARSGPLTSPVFRVLVHDLAGGEAVVKIIPNDGADLAWAPDGSRFAVATPSPRLGVRHSVITLYDAATGELRAPLEASSSDGFSVGYLGPVFSPDGRRLAAFTSSLGAVQVKVWDVASGRELLTLRPATSWPADAAENGWQRLAFFADGLLLAESGGSDRRGDGRVLALTTWNATPPAAK